jgi:hypothetical protein
MTDRDPNALQRQLSEIETQLQAKLAELALSTGDQKRWLDEIIQTLQNQKNELSAQISNDRF